MDFNSTETWFRLLASLGAWLVIWLLPVVLLVGLAYYGISLPLRRQERARLFLDLIDTGLRSGRSVEDTVVSIARSGDVSVGVRFHLLAAYLESGHRLIRALEKVPRLLPPQVLGILKVGQEIGDIGRVIPGCQRLLRDGGSKMRAGVNYQIVMLFVFNPLVFMFLPFIEAKVMPAIGEIQSSFGRNLPGPARWLIDYGGLVYGAQWLCVVLLCLGAVGFVGGPRLFYWVQAGLYPFADWILYWLPWRRKRLQRDFATMLAILLDAEVPEERALALAAESTTNHVFIRGARRVERALEQGQPLMEAVQELDDSGELRWRLTNAARAQRGFLDALTGWQEALDAKAFQQEQSAAHVVSTVLVIINGIIISIIAVAVFGGISGIHSLFV